MTAAPPAGIGATFVARALESGTAGQVMQALRSTEGIDAEDLAAALVDEAESRLRRDPRLAFWLAFSGVRAAERAGRASIVARGMCCAGDALVSQGHMRGALRLYDRAIGAHHLAGSRADVGAVIIRRIRPLAYQGRFDEAAAAGFAARRIFEALRQDRRLIEIENALGDLETRRDRFREALDHFRRARALVAADTSVRLVAILDVNCANCLGALHRYGAAKRYFERARAVFEREGLHHTVAQIDQNRAYFAFLRGRYAEALELYQRAESAVSELSDTAEMAPIRLELAEIHLQMGMPVEARALARAAANRFAREGRAKEGAQALYFVAVAELLEGASDAADAAAREARDRFVAQDADAWVAECDLLRAHAAPRADDGGRAAAKLAESALRTFLDLGRPMRAASAEILLARLDLAAGRAASALARLDQAEERMRRIHAPWVEMELRRAKGLAHLALGDADRGIASLDRAARVLDAHRGGVPADEFMVSFLASKSAVYAETIEALVASDRVVEAFDCCERSRSRALVDMLSARRGALPGLRRRRLDLGDMKTRKLREDLTALYARLHRDRATDDSSTADRGAATNSAIASREADLAALSRAAWSRDPEFASLSAVGALDVGRVREALDAETTLLEYFVTPRRVFVFVVRRDSIAVRSVDVDEEEIARRLRRFRFHLAQFQLSDEKVAASAELRLRATRANLEELSDLVVGPVRDALSTRRVVVAPHGLLHDMPFHALPDGDGWLCDRFDVSYAPSATVHGFCAAKAARSRGPDSVIALPDESAPLIGEEAARVAATLGPRTRLFVGADATTARLREAASTSRLLHVATHGMFRPDRPSLSCVRLADSWLNLYDVYDLDVRAELVVLSACETGVVEAGRGDEALGLLRGFLYAGAPRVLASRWRVNDRSTTEFMSSFYEILKAGGAYEEALRRAMSCVRQVWPHPYHWAAFAFVGDARGRPTKESAV